MVGRANGGRRERYRVREKERGSERRWKEEASERGRGCARGGGGRRASSWCMW